MTCFGGGASTCLHPGALAVVVLESVLLLLLLYTAAAAAATAGDQDHGNDCGRDNREDGEDDQTAVRTLFLHRRGRLDDRRKRSSCDHRDLSTPPLTPLAVAALRVPRSPERVLVIGCGNGEPAIFLAREFPRARVRGVDPSEALIREASARVGLDPEGRIAFKAGRAASLPYPDEFFDLVALVDERPEMREVARVLSPGGYLILARTSRPAGTLCRGSCAGAAQTRAQRPRTGRGGRGRRGRLLHRPPLRPWLNSPSI